MAAEPSVNPEKRKVLTILRMIGSRTWWGLKLLGNGVLAVVAFILFLAPVSWLSRWEASGVWLVPYYLIMVSLTSAGVALLLTPRGRKWMTESGNGGNQFPYWFAAWVALAVIILGFALFTTFTWEVLADDGRLISTDGRSLSRDRLADFYLWHALEFVPLLKITETLDWQTPVTYSGGAVGWLLLLFKSAIVVPVVLAFRSFSRTHKDRAAAQNATEEM